MNKVVHRSSERGQAEIDWLSTRYSFSFANWYDPSRMGFGALRVINDDRIMPSSGFGMHHHEDMEIITIVTHGTVTHEDSMGNVGHVPAGDVQVMSAGTGVTHAERNDSQTDELALFQIWITPNKFGASARYAQKAFGLTSSDPGLTLLVAPNNEGGALPIYQDAYIYQGVVDSANPLPFRLKNTNHGVYVFVVEGEIVLEKEVLGARDAMGVSDTETLTLESNSFARVLVIEVPM